MMQLLKGLTVLLVLGACSCLVCATETEQPEKGSIETLSPDGQFGFRYTREPNSEPDSEMQPKQTFDLIERQSGKVVQTVAESDPEAGPSSRFAMEVLWRPDSKAFAVTETFWKRGSSVEVYLPSGSSFRVIKLPRLVVDVPDKVKKGKILQHVIESNSQSAVRWEKDGSLVMQIETAVDGNDGSITATRTVTLGFDRPGPARILKSTIEYETQRDWDAEAQAAWDKGDLDAVIAATEHALKQDPTDVTGRYYRGCAYFVKRDWTKALPDFQRRCESSKEEKYPGLDACFYIWLIRARLGDKEAADKELAPHMQGHPAEWSNGWGAKTGNFLLGKTSEQDFLLSFNDKRAWLGFTPA